MSHTNVITAITANARTVNPFVISPNEISGIVTSVTNAPAPKVTHSKSFLSLSPSLERNVNLNSNTRPAATAAQIAKPDFARSKSLK